LEIFALGGHSSFFGFFFEVGGLGVGGSEGSEVGGLEVGGSELNIGLQYC
jgi:hypothetical protein